MEVLIGNNGGGHMKLISMSDLAKILEKKEVV
jgi:hypothetical protein